jgi:predicted nucleotidyltransferase
MTVLREARRKAKLTQTQLAELAGVSQPHISGFESGTRPMSQAMERRLLSVMVLPSERLDAHRSEIRDLIAAKGGRNPMLFGSVARGSDTPGSDIDIMVDPAEMDVYDFVLLAEEIESLVGARVDVVSARGLTPKHSDVMAEAVPL